MVGQEYGSSSNPKTLVMKFGGTSVGTSDAIAQVIQITKNTLPEWHRMVIVASALSGVTNGLLDSAIRAAAGDTQTANKTAQIFLTRHYAIADTLIHDPDLLSRIKSEINRLIFDFMNLCSAISVLGEATPRALDAVASLGERMSVRLIAGAFESAGIPAQFVESTQFIITDNRFQDAHPDLEKSGHLTRKILEPILNNGIIPIVTGFIGATADHVTTTLGRGGSDYSAALVGAALAADEVWIWTDVDGVMSADPRIVPEARTIPELTFREVAELAYAGAKVLHPKTIRPIIEAGIGLRVCNTFNPDNPGTRLVGDKIGKANGDVKSITAIRGLKLVTVEGKGMLGVPGVAARTFGAVASTGTSVPLISQASSEQSICFAVPVESADLVVRELESALALEIARQDIDRVWTTNEVVIVTVVGAGMRDTPGVAGRVFSALGQAGVNVIAIAQGSSEVSISLVADAQDTHRAVRALHNLVE